MSEPITDLETAVRVLGALPMPAGSDPQTDGEKPKAPWGRAEDGRPLLPLGAHWTDVPELVDREVAKIQGRVDQATSGHWYDASATETWRAPGTVRTNVDGYHRTVGRVTNMSDTDLELVLHAHDDLSWCLRLIAKLRGEVAALRAERHETNEALDDVVRELRWLRPRTAEQRPADEAPKVEDDVTPQVEKLRNLLAGQREELDGEHYASVHRDYRKSRDLPQTGGA
ncbi:hypothetical protein ACH5A3_21060 [Streptomyces echinatus]|uniref:hypothetical protein n=1 Tax=Streptomyces echinatus TaxID=67293 RepID=UPI003795CA0E